MWGFIRIRWTVVKDLRNSSWKFIKFIANIGKHQFCDSKRMRSRDWEIPKIPVFELACPPYSDPHFIINIYIEQYQ